MVMKGHNHDNSADAKARLPEAIDCETQTLLRLFLGPILETASNWDEIKGRFTEKGYGISIRDGRLVILNENGAALCTARGLGVPFAQIASRIGRPNLRMSADGRVGELF